MQHCPIRFARLTQPLGFALLLGHFLMSRFDAFRILFWAGVFFTLLGTALEVWSFFRTAVNKRTQVSWVFGFGITTKLLLIIAIALRVYDVKWSLFILLGCTILTFIWLALSQWVKPDRDGNKDFLDVK
jgi:hypothetical protein